jgi:hypothetical protein
MVRNSGVHGAFMGLSAPHPKQAKRPAPVLSQLPTMRKKGDNSCVKQCEENQTKKITLFYLKNPLYSTVAMLSVPNKNQTNPYKSKQIQTCLAKTPNNTPSRPSGLHPC